MSTKPKKPTAKTTMPNWLTSSRPYATFFNVVRYRSFARVYVAISFAVLVATTVLWTILGAKLQQSNADQLINAMLFRDGPTFDGAQFPGAHSFLLKWPLFALVHVFGYTSASYIGVTLIATLLTVLAFAYVIYRLDKRPLRFATAWLALSSVLLLIPAQPYAGGLLPVNMAMMTTRNLEYVFYIVGLVLVLRATKFRSRQTAIAIGVFGLLFASDKLFLAMSLGGALLALITYGALKQWRLVTMAVNWMLASIAGAVASIALVAAIGALHITTILGKDASPYQIIDTAHDGVLGSFYAIFSLATNWGANPAFNATTLRGIPSTAMHNLASAGVVGYVVNAVLVIVAIILIGRFLLTNAKGHASTNQKLPQSTALALALVWTTVAVVGQYVLTQHDYVVDARYLTIALFTLFVVVITALRKRRIAAEYVAALGVVLLVAIACSSWYVVQTSRTQAAALTDVNARNTKIAQILGNHRTDILVGDYWRVIPTQLKTKQLAQKIMPLADCSVPRTVLTSAPWNADLTKHSFAYLISFDKSLTDYPSCDLHKITLRYGLPNSTELVFGTLDNPKELLLFYDTGAHPHIHVRTVATAKVLPTPITELDHTTCQVPTVMQFVAHQDDDLLFMSPDLLRTIKDGDCVRTVYLTAGDAGSSEGYWLARERGAEAAYAKMLNIPNDWEQHDISLSSGQFVRIANPKGNNHVSLIFLHLPDGGLKGDGFSATKQATLAKLYGGQIANMRTVDNQSTYTSAQLVKTLSTLMHVYQPSQLRAQSNVAGGQIQDHSDHRAGGQFVKKAYQQFEEEQYDSKLMIPFSYYVGYPIRPNPANVSGLELEQKEAAFLEYAKYDGGVCQTDVICDNTPTYGSYLHREYQSNY